MTKLEIIRRLTRMADTQAGEETTAVDSREYYRLVGDLKAEAGAGAGVTRGRAPGGPDSREKVKR